MIVVETLLTLWKRQGHRVLVFTQSRQMLGIMEDFVRNAGYSYLKLDGSTSIAARQPLINKFNQNPSYYAMLLTTRVGGLGVNLTGANRVLIYDPDWNPATDLQARERAWRIGQTQTVTVYRLITAGTIEEKMYHRQIFKQFLCNKVLKDPRQRRFFKSNDLYELFTLKETDIDGSTETAAIFAGTDSEVKLDLTKKYKHRRIEPKLEARPPAETFSRKQAEKKKCIKEKVKSKSEESNSNSAAGISFSSDKIERMKKLAQMLSQKVVQNVSPDKTDERPETFECTQGKTLKMDEVISLSEDDTPGCRAGFDPSKPSTSESCQTLERKFSTHKPIKGTNTNHRLKEHKLEKHRKKHKSKKRQKNIKFEGERIPHLVKAGDASSKTADDNEEDKNNYATQDEYVLKKLFSKSGLQTALKHDTIMDGGPADYALVEGEADRVARQAVEKLKESRRECWRPSSGVPNFTGMNGARNFQPKKRFGSGKSSVEGLTSSQLLEQIRKRNGTVNAKDSDLDLVDDIRQFISSHGGTANTEQLIARFEGRLAEGSSPLFKSLLSKICSFYRAPDKRGYWTLRDEFSW